MNPALLQLVLAGIPEIPRLIADFRSLFQKMPALTPAQIVQNVASIAQSTDAEADALLAKIAADQNPAPPPPPPHA